MTTITNPSSSIQPRTIDNGGGESLTFLGVHEDERGPYVHVRNRVQPGGGPPMHVHHLQAESLTVERGTIGYERQGEAPQTAGSGETVSFEAGQVRRFWNAGDDVLECDGWIGPPDNVEYFLTNIFASMRANGGKRPGMYDSAFLATRYRSEFGFAEIPRSVQRLLFPVVLGVGRVLGWHRRFAGAPEPVRR